MAKARYVDDGEIRLSAFTGEFSTPLLTDGKRVRVAGEDLVVDDSDGSQRIKLSTVGEAADFVGIEPGFPAQLHPPATAFQPDQVLDIDPRAAEVLAAWYGFARPVRTFATDEFGLDHGNTEAASRNPSRDVLTSGPGTDHDDIKGLFHAGCSTPSRSFVSLEFLRNESRAENTELTIVNLWRQPLEGEIHARSRRKERTRYRR